MYLLSSAEGARAVVAGLHAASGEASSFQIKSKKYVIKPSEEKMIMRPSVKLGKDLKKLTLGPNLGPLKYFFFVVFFDINIKNKAYSIKFYKHIVSNYKNIASYLFSV